MVLTTGVTLWSVFTCVTPAAASMGTAPLLAARVLLGVGEGVAFPAVHSIIGDQAKPEHCSMDHCARVSQLPDMSADAEVFCTSADTARTVAQCTRLY